jgi:hypothetical protein
MLAIRIRSSPRAKRGRQFRADHCPSAASDFNPSAAGPVIRRERPGPGHRHVLGIRHVKAFLDILPDWPTLSVGLDTIVLARGVPFCDGYHYPGVVAVCAQPRDLSQLIHGADYVDEHRDLFDRLGVPIDQTCAGHVLHFTPETLRAYQLLHILLHELGHHHDRMTTRSQLRASRGEEFAESYARAHADIIWKRYFATCAEV